MSDQPRIPERAHPRKYHSAIIVILICLVILTGLGLIFYPTLKQRWTAPLGPALEMQTSTPAADFEPPAASPTDSLLTTPPPTDPGPAASISTSNAAAPVTTTPTITPQPLCGGPPVMFVLAIGADNGDYTYQYGLADVVRIVRVDFVTPKLTALSMPRDLWVEIPGISDHYEITHGKLNQAYFYGGPGMGYYDGPGFGPGLLARTLQLNFGAQVDHYGAVSMQAFVDIINAVGGIDIYLPTDVDGTPIDSKTENMGYFTAGQHHFNGTQALKFSRIRKRYNDFTRGDFQNMVLCALRKKVLTPEVLPKVPKIIASLQHSILTDLSLEQLSQLACLLPKLDTENIIFTGMPQETFKPGRVYSPQQKDWTYYLEVDNQVVRDYVSRFLSGEWPDQAGEPTCQ